MYSVIGFIYDKMIFIKCCYNSMKDYKLSIPLDLGSITLGQYQDYLKILEKWDNEDEDYLKIKILQIFCELSPSIVKDIPLHSFESTINHITGLFESETPLIRHFKMTGKNSDGENTNVEFGFIPKLDDISFGEFIDLDKYLQGWDNMHKAMAVLFRPVSHKKKSFYLIDKYEGSSRYSNVMRDMPLNVALGATVFFYRLGMKLQSYTMDYLQEAIMKQKDNPQVSKLISEKNGIGINQYIHSLKVMLEELMKLRKPVFISAL